MSTLRSAFLGRPVSLDEAAPSLMQQPDQETIRAFSTGVQSTISVESDGTGSARATLDTERLAEQIVKLSEAAARKAAKQAMAAQESSSPAGFLSLASFTNFTAMSGAIYAAWNFLNDLRIGKAGSTIETTLTGDSLLLILSGLAAVALFSISISDIPRKARSGFSKLFPLVFVGFLNGLILAAAVKGITEAI